ncbi:MAG: glyceraldehyde-3-phosphate dehydrogenase [Bacteroidales bacterium]|nr:glyceraldehyde-3-phosphate dehydrogenase [Bacteroidales bacterium]MCF8333387.1 glyceraldehyde-3-phosphate dehydrogenase [Bacteroidales bacterium]
MTQKNTHQQPVMSNHQFEKQLDEWIKDERLALEFIQITGKLWFDKAVELILFRRQLLDRGAHSILHKHSYAENTIGFKLKIKDSLLLANKIYETNIAPSRIDIGRLNKEWVEEGAKYRDAAEFIHTKLNHLIDVEPRSEKSQDVVLFGFGRIGRLAARQLITEAGDGNRLRLRAIVTRSNNAEDLYKRISLFRKDSVHGNFHGIAMEDIDKQKMIVNGHHIHMITANNPEEIDYEQYGIKDALVIDNTGVWRNKEGLSRHLKAKGVKQVLLTAPGKDDIPNVVYGVNQNSKEWDLTQEPIVSAASCTTNAIVPILSALENEIGIENGHVETIHSYTNDQNLLDNIHKKSRRGRAASLNMVITETGAAKAAAKAVPSLKGKLTANAVRIPTPNVSLAILTLDLKQSTTKEDINEFIRRVSLQGTLIEQIRYMNSTELVSSDVIGDSCASVYDSDATKVSSDGKKVVLYLWYDNEFGYTSQVIRLSKHIAQVKSYRYY